MNQSQLLFERSKRVSPGGVHSPVRAFKNVGVPPRFIASADRCTLKDVDGKNYIDFCMAWGPLLFGHRDPEITEAVQEALSRGWSYGTAEPYSLELAELIVEQIPWVEKIRFVNSGTEAVMSALRVARAATGRDKILKFEGCYHGHVDSMLVKAGSGLAEMASPDSAGIARSTAAETIVVPLDDEAALGRAFEIHGQSIAAAIIEPLPANNGLLLQRPEFLTKLVEYCRKHSALVIFDEVISGFRVDLKGMTEFLDLRPDLVTYGKVIGGGFPVGAYGGRADLMDLVAPSGPVYQAGTLSANPVAMAAGLAMLKKIMRENPFPRLEAMTLSLCTALEKIAAESPHPVRIQHFGSLFWLVFDARKTVTRTVSAIPKGQKEAFAPLFRELLEHGIYLPPSGYEVGFLSTAHDQDACDAFVTQFSAAVQKLQ